MLHRAKRTRDPHKSEIPRELSSDRIVPILTKAARYTLFERNREKERERETNSRLLEIEARSEIESLHN